MSMSYAGIGSRKTPNDILEIMVKLGSYLAFNGWILRSGGANGADSAFEYGCNRSNGAKEIFLPWKGFNKNESTYFNPSRKAMELASKIHPNWNACSLAARNLHSRNMHQVLGIELNDPVKMVLYWKPEDSSSGTDQALRLAKCIDIPCIMVVNDLDFMKNTINSIKH